MTFVQYCILFFQYSFFFLCSFIIIIITCECNVFERGNPFESNRFSVSMPNKQWILHIAVANFIRSENKNKKWRKYVWICAKIFCDKTRKTNRKIIKIYHLFCCWCCWLSFHPSKQSNQTFLWHLFCLHWQWLNLQNFHAEHKKGVWNEHVHEKSTLSRNRKFCEYNEWYAFTACINTL